MISSIYLSNFNINFISIFFSNHKNPSINSLFRCVTYSVPNMSSVTSVDSLNKYTGVHVWDNKGCLYHASKLQNSGVRKHLEKLEEMWPVKNFIENY